MGKMVTRGRGRIDRTPRKDPPRKWGVVKMTTLEKPGNLGEMAKVWLMQIRSSSRELDPGSEHAPVCAGMCERGCPGARVPEVPVVPEPGPI